MEQLASMFLVFHFLINCLKQLKSNSLIEYTFHSKTLSRRGRKNDLSNENLDAIDAIG